jgi:glycosyltransferase involved in cell wall biosynthesis
MKVLLINKFHYLKGGAERVYFNTKKTLEDAGHTVICFSTKDDKNLPCDQENYFVDNVDFTSNKKPFKKAFRLIYYRKAAKNLDQLIKAEKPDIAHLHNVSHHLSYSILKPLISHKIPIVQTLHDYQLISPNYHLFCRGKICENTKNGNYYNCIFHRCVKNSFLKSILGAFELYFYKYLRVQEKINLFISPSKFLKEKFQEFGFNSKIEVIPNFLNTGNYKPQYEAGDYIVFAGRLSAEKGLLNLLKAIKQLPDIKLKIVGDGPLKKELHTYTQLENINNVEFTGHQNGQQFQDSIRNSKFVVVPSIWYENYPMTVIEAEAYGKPVLASNIGGLNEQIINRYNGLHFKYYSVADLTDKITKLFASTDLENYGRNARAEVEKTNSEDTYYENIISIYNKLLPTEKKISLG